MNSSKEKYKKLCTENTSIPIFLRYNWYNTLFNEDEWGVVIEEQGKEIVGFIPYLIHSKYGFKMILPPFLTPYQGVWLIYPLKQKYTNKLSFEKEVINSLISKLPKTAFFKQKCYPTFTNWLPFFWRGYSQTTKYTYILEDLTDLQKVFDDFRENIRREIRKAEKNLSVIDFNDVNFFHLLNEISYKDKKMNYPFSFIFLNSLVNFCIKNNCGKMIAAVDNEQNIHSILFYVWDNHTAYYLHGVTNPKFKTSGSMSLLLWEAIKQSSKNIQQFNFEGSVVESIERYFRAFGGNQVPYFEIHKYNSKIIELLDFFRGSRL